MLIAKRHRKSLRCFAHDLQRVDGGRLSLLISSKGPLIKILMKAMTRRAAVRMSAIISSSLGVYDTRGSEDMLASYPIRTLFYCTFLDQVYVTAEKCLKLIFGMDEVKQSPMSVWGKCHKQVDITLRCEVVSQRRPEERDLGDLPVPAEISQDMIVDPKPRPHDYSHPSSCIAELSTVRSKN
jgi:hypothetical protein